MIKFLEGQTYYALADRKYYSDIHAVGRYNSIILQRIDECPVGPAVARVTLQTADDPTLADWLEVPGDIAVDEITYLTTFGQHLRVAVEMQPSASSWADATSYFVDDYVATGVIWTCISAER